MSQSPTTALRIAAMTRYRVLVLGVFLIVTSLVRLLGVPFPGAVIGILAVWLVASSCFSVFLGRARGQQRPVQLQTAAYVVDITVITAIYLQLGGGWWMGGLFYAFTLLFASMSAPLAHSVALGAYAATAYTTLLLLQAAGIVHATPFMGMAPFVATWPITVTTAGVGAAALLLMALLPNRFVALTQRSEERHGQLLEASQEGVWMTSAEGATQYVNPRVSELLGHSRAASLGQRLLDCADSDGRAGLAEALERCRRGVRDISEHRFRHADGSLRWIRVSLSPVADPAGHAGGVLAMLSDVTERKRAEEALERSEASARSFVENAPYGIYRSTLDGRFLEVNPALVHLLGYESEAELRMVHIGTDLYHDPTERLRLMALSFAREDEDTEPVEVVWKRRDGALITLRLYHRQLTDVRGAFLHWEGFVEDVTELRVAERALREKDERLRLSQRLEAVGQLAGGVAHDFNNLITVIKVTSELLLDEAPPDAGHRADVQEISRAADSAAALTRQLLAFSRKQVLLPRVLDLNAIVIEMQPMLRRLIGEDVQLSAATASDIWCVNADPGQLEQVIMNLVVNARDAMPEGGTLCIVTRNLDLGVSRDDESHIPVDVPPGRYVVLGVSDTGMGMDRDTQTHMFEPFFTTKATGRGTGLGLATVYGIVKQSGGYIGVRSAVGEGATLEIYLPRVEAGGVADIATPNSSAVPAIGERPDARVPTVLLVEDQDAVRRLARRILHRHGYVVIEAMDGADAMRRWARHPGPIDLLVTDVVMPHMGGRQLADQLRALRPELAVLFMSGYTNGALNQREALSPEDAFLEKPFSPQALALKVQQVLAASTQRDSMVA